MKDGNTAMTSYCQALGHWAASCSGFPDDARNAARLSFLDTFGCIVAGYEEPQAKIARSAFVGWRSPGATALILGTAAHALDFDDYETPGSTHPSAPVFASLLALAVDHAVSWRAMLDAYIVGYEAIVRLGQAMGYAHYEAGWHSTGTIGAVGAAAASATLLGLDSNSIAHAIALSASMAAGPKAQFGTHAKALHAGLAAKSGVEAACLAQAGARANLTVFEGPFGFMSLHEGASNRDLSTIYDRIGVLLGIAEFPILRKPWPSCSYTHRAIEAALHLASLLRGQSPIASVHIRIPEPFFRVAGFMNPTNGNEARFSVCYCVAAALVDGRIGPATFGADALARPDLATLLRKTTVDAYDPGPGIDDMSPAHPDSVTVTLSDGRTETCTVSDVMGGPSAPLTSDQLIAKFLTCGGSEATATTILTTSPEDRFNCRFGDRVPVILPSA